jgi:hypothetical protein
MNREQAKQLVRDTFTHAFQKDQFRRFIKELLNRYDERKAQVWNKQYIPDAFKDYIDRYERLGTYAAADGEKLDILIVYLAHDSTLERARTALRNFVAYHLKTRDEKEAGLIAFISPTEKSWRFSFVRMEYETELTETGIARAKLNLTSARRFSYLVGEGESCHTAQSRFLDLLQETSTDPTLEQIADSFSVETVTKEFFARYYTLFKGLKEAIEKIVSNDKTVREEFSAKAVKTDDFAKKLLGQIVFLYFIQKKGWLGVQRGQEWGTGPRDFLRRLAAGGYGPFKNLFNDVLEPLFYDSLATDRGPEAWYKPFKTRIPFLNGGLFEPLSAYDWKATDLTLPNNLFFNDDVTTDGDKGTGILDVFDRYNFTVNEAEPLEQEVAIDPEMLGKVFENLIEDNLRKGTGAFYTPREIVHYMCQESLISYLYRTLNSRSFPILPPKPIQDGLFVPPKPVQGVLTTSEVVERVPREELSALVHLGDQAAHYQAALRAGTSSYEKKARPRLAKSIEQHAQEIDDALRTVTVCDPAIGSGAFPVGMMTEIVRARLALNPYFADDPQRTAYYFKRHAIHNCLYGVDLDRGAVEIAKLRLWLSLVVDEEDPRDIRPLPNLDYKIVAGHSLIGFPFKSQGMTNIETWKREYCEETDHDRKQRLKEKIDNAIQERFRLSVKSLGYAVNFDFHLWFSEVFEKGGFDVVIANPPYISAMEFKKFYPAKERETLNGIFATAKGAYDIYVLFIEKGIRLLKKGGTLCYINPNKYLSAKYAVALREFISREVQLNRIVDVSGIRVFETAAVYPVVTFMSKHPAGQQYSVETVLPRVRDLERFDLKEFDTSKVDSQLLQMLPESIWGFLLSTKIDLLLRLMENAERLSDGAEINATTTASEADAYGEHLSERETANAAKVVNTGTIERYASLWGIRKLTHGGSHFERPYLPLSEAHVNARRSELYRTPKLIFAKMAKACEAFLDVRGEFAALNVNCLYGPKRASLEFYAAYCNSKLFMFFYEQFFGALRMSGGYYQFQSPQLRVLPFRAPDPKTEEEVKCLVNRILTAKAKNAEATTEAHEEQIDTLLFLMYRLSCADIKRIEQRGERAKDGEEPLAEDSV